MKKRICNVFAFLFFVQLSYGQAAPKEKEKERKWNYNFGIGFLSTKIKNESITADKTLRTQSKNHPMIELNVSRKLGDLFNFTTALQCRSFLLLRIA